MKLCSNDVFNSSIDDINFADESMSSIEDLALNIGARGMEIVPK